MDPQNQKYASGSQALIKKMIPQLLISVSLFSFVVSFSSLYNTNSNSSAPKIHHYLSSAKSFHLLSKNCLFLICNGLLVFLSKTSGLIQPPTAHDLSVAGDALHSPQPPLHRFHDELESESDESADVAGDGGGKSAEQVSIFIAESEEEEEQGREAAPHSEDVEKNNENQPDSAGCWLFDDDDGDRLYGHHDDEGEDEDEDGDEAGADKKEEISTEELNKKFEDFIRKMKDEIIINEARHKVLMLN